MTNDISTQPDPPTITTLLDRSLQLRQKLFGNDFPSFLSDATQLAYPSSYKMQPDPRGKASKAVQRGFCNWLVPNYIMIGQYPGMTPESNGPSQTECNRHIKNMVVDANVSLFCCLQSEVPCQSDDEGWTSNEIYLEPYYRREFPRPFTRYGRIAQELTDRELQFIHNPIDDLSVPTCNNSLLNLLSQLIRHLEVNDDGAMFIHCWGGRGRAGLIGSCLISLLFPELNSKEVLDFVQKAYSTREGKNCISKTTIVTALSTLFHMMI
jgi:alanine transaminase